MHKPLIQASESISDPIPHTIKYDMRHTPHLDQRQSTVHRDHMPAVVMRGTRIPDGWTYERYIKSVKNAKAFDDFRISNLDNPEFKGKYVVFINCKFAGVGDEEIALGLQMYDKFGYGDMHVGQITDKEEILCMDTLDFR